MRLSLNVNEELAFEALAYPPRRRAALNRPQMWDGRARPSAESMRAMTSISPADTLPTVVTPGDAGYDEQRRGWNLAADQRPAAIVTATTAGHVRAAVAYAAEHDLTVAAQGTATAPSPCRPSSARCCCAPSCTTPSRSTSPPAAPA